MNSPFANLYETIMARIKSEVTAVRYVNQDLGQLEYYNANTGRPAVSFPCALIDFDNFNADDLSDKSQELEGDVIIRIALDTWSSASSITPTEVRTKALSYYDVEHAVYKALHAWCPGPADSCGYLTRTGTATEQREDAIRVRVMRFRLRFRDDSACPIYQQATATPDITGEIT